MPTPDTLRWAAYEIRREAGALVPTINEFIDALGPTVWSGRKADATRSELESERNVLAQVALELEALASELEQRAEHEAAVIAQQHEARALAEASNDPQPLSEPPNDAHRWGASFVG